MRENKYRGKRVDNGEWIYGDLVHDAVDANARIVPVAIQERRCYPVEVIPETVGQFIGLEDKNEREIWKGDILHFTGTVYAGTPGHFNSVDMILPVDYSDNNGFQMYEKGWGHYKIYAHEVEVIGNIYDTPALLTGKGE